jgi:hypothetical protein
MKLWPIEERIARSASRIRGPAKTPAKEVSPKP